MLKSMVGIKEICCIILVVFLVAGGFALLWVPPGSAAVNGIEFRLKEFGSNPAIIDVTLRLNLSAGENAFLEPPLRADPVTGLQNGPEVTMLSTSNSELSIEALPDGEGGWKVTPTAAGSLDIEYRVDFSTADPRISPSEPSGEYAPPRSVTSTELKLFRASDLLICPRSTLGGAYMEGPYGILVEAAGEQEVFVPWEPAGDDTEGFLAVSSDELLENYVCWGDITVVDIKEEGPNIRAGFSRDYKSLEESERNQYADDLGLLYDYVEKKLGERPEMERLTVVLCGASPYGVHRATSGSLMDSVVLFHGGSSLHGVPASAAARGFFQLWNLYSLVPAPRGDALWFQEGMPWFYCYRLAALNGLMDSGEAYGEFSRVYATYLSNSAAFSTTLSAAEETGDIGLLGGKGGTVCASMSEKLWRDTDGSADIDWLLGALAEEFNGFQGEEYDLVDISEVLEGKTGESWDRFLEETVRGTRQVLASDFSSSGLFGENTTAGTGSELETEGSGRSWIYLLIAVLVIFMIPIVFSVYVRRSVKLEVEMPRILPDDEEEGEPVIIETEATEKSGGEDDRPAGEDETEEGNPSEETAGEEEGPTEKEGPKDSQE